MPHLSLRDLPQPTYDALKRLATRERRSMQQQAIVLLDAARVLEGSADVLRRAAAWRERIALPEDVDLAGELAAARGARP
jgi:transposase